MITVESLTRRYAGFTAVDNVSFSALPGRVTGFSVRTAPASPHDARGGRHDRPVPSGTATIAGERSPTSPTPASRWASSWLPVQHPVAPARDHDRRRAGPPAGASTDARARGLIIRWLLRLSACVGIVAATLSGTLGAVGRPAAGRAGIPVDARPADDLRRRCAPSMCLACSRDRGHRRRPGRDRQRKDRRGRHQGRTAGRSGDGSSGRRHRATSHTPSSRPGSPARSPATAGSARMPTPLGSGSWP